MYIPLTKQNEERFNNILKSLDRLSKSFAVEKKPSQSKEDFSKQVREYLGDENGHPGARLEKLLGIKIAEAKGILDYDLSTEQRKEIQNLTKDAEFRTLRPADKLQKLLDLGFNVKRQDPHGFETEWNQLFPTRRTFE